LANHAGGGKGRKRGRRRNFYGEIGIPLEKSLKDKNLEKNPRGTGYKEMRKNDTP